MKVGLVQFIYESNTFNPVPAELECFTVQGTWLTQADDIRRWSDQADTQMSGSLRVLEAAGVETWPAWVAVCGTPGGRLSAECHAKIKETWLSRLEAILPADALILHLHGAVCAAGVDDVEGELLEMVRSELGFSGRIVLSLDLHANVTPQMLEHVDMVTAYRTAPHEDFAETGERAARLLLEAPKGVTRSLAKMAALIPPTATNHREGPLAEMLAVARRWEETPEILDVSVFPVQPWLDVEGLGSSVVVTATESIVAETTAGGLAEAWFDQRGQWETGLKTWDEIRKTLSQAAKAPWFLVDTADATSGGSPGSSAEALAQLWPLRNDLIGEVLLWVVDPVAVAAGSAGKQTFPVGDPSVRVEGVTNSIGELRFRPRGRAYTGQEISCGAAVTVEAGQLRLVVTEKGCLCSDPAFFEALGWSPETALAVHVKSLLGWQAGYQAERSRGLYFDGPGLTSLDFAKLSFTGGRRELFPMTPEVPHPVTLWQSN